VVDTSDRHASGNDDQEFDWRVFRWQRLEHTGRIPIAAKNSAAAEVSTLSCDTSRRGSPRPDQLDASAVSSLGSHTPLNPPIFLSPIGPVDAYHVGSNLHPGASDPLAQLQGTEPWLLNNSSRAGGDNPRFLEDDFSRFMEQAGYATGSGEDALSWLQVDER
jgi:hypothetical protein